MIPASFAYHRPQSLEEAVGLLALEQTIARGRASVHVERLALFIDPVREAISPWNHRAAPAHGAGMLGATRA